MRGFAAYRGGRLLVGTPKSGEAHRVDLASPLAAWLQVRKSLHEAEAAVQGRNLTPWVYPKTVSASRSTP